MEVWSEPAVVFEKSTMFTKSKFCKIYKVTSDKPSGDLPHSHDYMQIWYMRRGNCEHWVEGVRHRLTRGDIFIIPPKLEHQVLQLDDAEIISCEFSFDHFFPPQENSTYRQLRETTLGLSFVWLFLKDKDEMQSQFSLRPEIGERVNGLMNSMLTEYQNEEIYYEEFLRVQIMELLLLLAREYSQSTRNGAAIDAYEKYKPMVEKVMRYVEEHYNEPLKLDDICRLSLMSRAYFCYLFKLLTQQTLMEYIVNLRVQKAMELLKDPANSITEVGYEVGFNDSTHFSRTFKKVVGVSPRTYRAIKNEQTEGR